MRLSTTNKALCACIGRRTGPLNRVGTHIVSFQPQLVSVGLRYTSSANAQIREESAELPQSGATSYPASPGKAEKQICIQGTAYVTDQWTNTPDSILSHIGRCLYLDENHPLTITRRLIESQFCGPVFGNYAEKHPVVSTTQNFDVLGFPADHPGRSRTDTYYINKDTLLRTHTSAHQHAYFQRLVGSRNKDSTEEGYTVIADVYRRDAIDRSHYPVFHQMEGARLWKRPRRNPLQYSAETVSGILRDVDRLSSNDVVVEDPNPTTHPDRNPPQSDYHSPEEIDAVAAHLKRSLEGLVYKIFTEAKKATHDILDAKQEPLKMRWVEAYFPFTSPSWELEVFWQDDWLEILGCGVIKQDLLVNSNAGDHIGWAFGLGIERLAMLLFNIHDIRLFWSRDKRFLSQFSAGKISRFEPFSKYPSCYKDVAFWPKPSGKVSGGGGALPFHENDVMEIVRDVAGNLVEDVKLVDEFTHPKTGRQSLCYRINYRSLERTLTNKETNELHERVRQQLVEKADIELR